MNVRRALAAEAVGSFFLFATVIGSGIMAERLAGGHVAVALLANTLATVAMLFVLINIFGPLSGAHFNPAVSVAMAERGRLPWAWLPAFIAAQLIGGIAGALASHAMFDLPLLQWSTKARSSPGQWIAEAIATFGLLLTIFGTVRHRPSWVAPAVAAYIGAAYWFTASTSFANPAITLVRAMSDSFAGIALKDVPAFVIAQLIGASLAMLSARWLFGDDEAAA